MSVGPAVCAGNDLGTRVGAGTDVVKQWPAAVLSLKAGPVVGLAWDNGN